MGKQQSLVWNVFRKLHLWLDVFGFLVVFALALRFGGHTIFWFAGVTLACICFPIWILARVQLGSSFTVMPEANRLVTRGLYSRFQHPIYIFGSAAYFGALLALQIWYIVALWLAMLPLQIIRARKERRILRARFGEQYDEYRRGTWF
ncbi:MAG: isoprenylcysteine carboxylmethyltransferase family protein [Acidobacteriota bacterium]|nr:isoprenylcysteine carboxylmethyltransferase family protein [Acidobacteriota bacterium]